MKVSKDWLKHLIDLCTPFEEVERLLPLRSIAIKEFAQDYFELDMKGYNRADLLSLRGVACEVAAITNSAVNFTESKENEYIWFGKNVPKVQVKVGNKTLCPFYCLAKIEGLKSDKSPKNWIKKLEQSGIRSINNIADITNLIMWEYGQPLHSFDANSVENEEIIVRVAKDGEKLTTLDGKVRDLTPKDLVIADPKKALGLAGVMGGKNSEITDSTTTILLEAAIFDPVMIRQTATRLNLESEASKRFEHGLTKKRLLQALNAAIRMYQDLGGKLVGLTIVGEFEDQVRKIELGIEKLNSLIGVEIDPKFIEESLTKLHFALEKIKEGRWVVIPPYFRLDINLEEDIIEEVARLYGYENIPSTALPEELPAPIDQKLVHFLYDVKAELVKIGLTEVETYSYFSTQVIENLKLNSKNLIRIGNSMSAETEYLRSDLWPNLLQVAAKNLKTRKSLAIFEVGKVYLAQKTSVPEEEYRLAMLVVSDTTESIQELYAELHKMADDFKLKFDIDEDKKDEGIFHPLRNVEIKHKGKIIGRIAEIHPRVTDKFGISQRVAILEIKIDPLAEK
ncbi:MAG: phenylalanine--tRNA ligase subunit beta [Candidatus Daviesbacteria bacterium]